MGTRLPAYLSPQFIPAYESLFLNPEHHKPRPFYSEGMCRTALSAWLWNVSTSHHRSMRLAVICVWRDVRRAVFAHRRIAGVSALDAGKGIVAEFVGWRPQYLQGFVRCPRVQIIIPSRCSQGISVSFRRPSPPSIS